MPNTVQEIEDFLAKFQPRAKLEFEYAIYLTLGLSEICDLFFNYVLNRSVRDKLVRQIKARIEKNGENLPDYFIAKLISAFNESDKRSRRSLGKVINDLRGILTSDQAAFLINIQVGSDKISDRKRAYEMCELVYDDEIDSRMWLSWKLYKDENCLAALNKFTSDEKIAINFGEIWSSNCKFRTKNNALKKAARFDFEKVIFLKEVAPVSYLTACVSAKKGVDDEFLWKLINSLDRINSLGYVLWCLGMLGKRELIMKVLETNEIIESRCPVETWEPRFYGF